MHVIKNVALILLPFFGWATAANYNEMADYTADMLVEVSNLSRSLLSRLMSTELVDEWSLNIEAKSGVFRVHADDLADVKKMLKGTKSRLAVKHRNLQELIDTERLGMQMKSADGDWHTRYHEFEEINQFFVDLAADNPELVKFVSEIGRSYEGRSIFAVHFKGQESRSKVDEESRLGSSFCRKKAPNKIWIQCLIHAREWISGSTCQYIAQELTEGYHSGDQSIRSLLDTNEVIMVPVVNPDGYAHTWSKDRLWRKNRQPFRFGTGVDLNRNFAEEHWCKTGASNVPFADTYCGPAAGSEPETKAIQAYYKRYQGRVAAAIDVHSFSQLILRPKGFDESLTPDEAKLLAASEAMADAIHAVHGKSYKALRSSQLYPTSGSATDYFYSLPEQAYRPYSIALELRPDAHSSMQGFLLDPSEIRPCVEEIMAGFMAFVQFALENPLVTEHSLVQCNQEH